MILYHLALVCMHSDNTDTWGSHSFHSKFEGHQRVTTMDWFIKKVFRTIAIASTLWLIFSGFPCRREQAGPSAILSNIPSLQRSTFEHHIIDTCLQGPRGFGCSHAKDRCARHSPSRTSISKTNSFELDKVFTLVNIEADLSRIPATSLRTQMGKDNQLYYKIEYEIEVTYFSAYTKYELIYKGINYGPVTAEYV